MSAITPRLSTQSATPSSAFVFLDYPLSSSLSINTADSPLTHPIPHNIPLQQQISSTPNHSRKSSCTSSRRRGVSGDVVRGASSSSRHGAASACSDDGSASGAAESAGLAVDDCCGCAAGDCGRERVVSVTLIALVDVIVRRVKRAEEATPRGLAAWSLGERRRSLRYEAERTRDGNEQGHTDNGSDIVRNN